jgi:hypothetical protein
MNINRHRLSNDLVVQRKNGRHNEEDDTIHR